MEKHWKIGVKVSDFQLFCRQMVTLFSQLSEAEGQACDHNETRERERKKRKKTDMIQNNRLN